MTYLNKNRKQRKLKYIRVKNDIRSDKECGNGLYWCNFEYDLKNPWVWVDFRFLSKRHKNRYYAVAMQTCEYAAIQEIEDTVWDKVCHEIPKPEFMKNWSIEKIEQIDVDFFSKRYECFKQLMQQEVKNSKKIIPHIQMRLREYGPVSIGLWVTVNKEYIDHNIIIEFISNFLSMGEELKHGKIYEEDEVTVSPGRLYFRQYAK